MQIGHGDTLAVEKLGTVAYSRCSSKLRPHNS